MSPEEQYADGFTSSSSGPASPGASHDTCESSSDSNSVVSSASGVFSFSSQDMADAGNTTAAAADPPADVPPFSPTPPARSAQAGGRAGAAATRPPIAKTIEEAESIFAALPAPLESDRRAEHGSRTSAPPAAARGGSPAEGEHERRPSGDGEETSSEDSWTTVQGLEPNNTNLWREHPEHGLQRVRLSSKVVAKSMQDQYQPPPGLVEDPDYPGVDLRTGKVTDHGVFESVAQRQQFIDLAEEVMGEKFDPKILAHGGQIKVMWWPDEPVFYNVTERRRVPMALPPGVRTPLYDDPNLLLREACKNGEVLEVVRQARGGADVNHTDPQFSHFTPLHWACWHGKSEVVQVLLGQLGAYPFPRDRADQTPWHIALASGKLELVALLESLGAGFPIMYSPVPLNSSTVDDPFTCTNEYLNPAFRTSDLYRTYNLRFAHGCFDSQLLPPSVLPFQPQLELGPAHGVSDVAEAAPSDAPAGTVYRMDEDEQGAEQVCVSVSVCLCVCVCLSLCVCVRVSM